MDNLEFLEEQQPESYEIIPEFNSAGRLCNYGSGGNAKVIVPAAEWERFNRLAGRQHEIIDGVVVYNPDLEPCLPDGVEPEPDARETKLAELSAACNAIIEAGVDVETANGRDHFNLTLYDQSNINSLFKVVELGGTQYLYQADGGECTVYSAVDIAKIYIAMQTTITTELTYHNILKEYVETLDGAELAGVVYGMELPEPYNSKKLEKLAVAQEQFGLIMGRLGLGA